jgi:hypothetical protein
MPEKGIHLASELSRRPQSRLSRSKADGLLRRPGHPAKNLVFSEIEVAFVVMKHGRPVFTRAKKILDTPLPGKQTTTRTIECNEIKDIYCLAFIVPRS